MKHDADHYHCLNNCEHACGELIDGAWLCANTNCRAPFVPCSPEICPEFRGVERMGGEG